MTLRVFVTGCHSIQIHHHHHHHQNNGADRSESERPATPLPGPRRWMARRGVCDPVRLFLGVKRVDRPSGLVADCCFVATLLVVQDSSRVPARPPPQPQNDGRRRVNYDGWVLFFCVNSGLNYNPKILDARCRIRLRPEPFRALALPHPSPPVRGPAA